MRQCSLRSWARWRLFGGEEVSEEGELGRLSREKRKGEKELVRER